MTDSLLEFLSEPRKWKEIKDWARHRGLSEGVKLRNALAWLDVRGKAVWKGEAPTGTKTAASILGGEWVKV